MKITAGVLSVALIGPSLLILAGKEKTQVLGKPRPDAALVYVHRKSAMAGGGKAMHVYYDDKLAAVLKNNTYTFAYITPGTHYFWDGLGERGPVDLAPGQTYYLSFHVVDGMSILPEAQGKVVIQKASGYIELTQKEQDKAAGTIAKKWPKYQAKLGSRLTPPGGAVAYTPPASTEGMIKVAAGTAVVAELMENLNSSVNEPDTNVWVRTTEDVEVSGNLFLRAGTPIKAVLRGVSESGRWRRGGQLDLAIVAVTAADGTVCPVIGQKAATGAKGSQVGAAVAAATLNVGAMVLASALTKGYEAFYPAGDAVKVFTLQDVWIKPVPVTAAPASRADPPAGVVKARARARIVCDFAKGTVPETIDILFEGIKEVTGAELFRVAGWDMPEPVRPVRVSGSQEGALAQFQGWALARFLRPGNAGTQLSFRLTTPGGVQVAEAQIPVAAR